MKSRAEDQRFPFRQAQAKSFAFCDYLIFSNRQIKRFGDLPHISKLSVWQRLALFFIYGVSGCPLFKKVYCIVE